MSDLPDRFVQLSAVLNDEHIERSEEIEAALLALIAGTTMFMLGEWGVAKSQLARRIAAYIEGGEFFDTDLDRFSTPEDLFGPRSLAALKANRWERELEGTLATADWAFIDEFFEGSSALLKSMLRALRERTFRNGTKIVPMPLTTVIVASNTVPTEERLMPLYDRLILRRQVKRIAGNDNFLRLLSLEIDEHPRPILTWSDVAEAQAQASEIEVPTELGVAIIDIKRRLADIDITPSDRRFREALKVVRAAAWLDGGRAEPIHLRCLADICWSHPDQIQPVADIVDAVIEPLMSEVDHLLREVVLIQRRINPNLDEELRQRLATELHRRIRDVEETYGALVAEARTARQREKLEKLSRALRTTSMAILRDLFKMTPEEVERALHGR